MHGHCIAYRSAVPNLYPAVCSYLLLQYCECFQNSVHCGLNCRCTNCKNFPEAGNPGGGHDPAVPTASATATGEGPPHEVTITVDSSSASQPATVHDAIAIQRRRVSLDHMSECPVVPNVTNAASSKSEDDSSSSEKREEKKSVVGRDTDRMAIMAAVAMTELLGGKTSPANTTSNHSTGTEASTPELSSEDAKVVSSTETSPARRMSDGSLSENENMPPQKKAKLSKDGEEGPSALSSTAASNQSPYSTSVRTPHAHCMKPFSPPGQFPYGHHPHHHHPQGVSPNGRFMGPPHMHHHPSMSPPPQGFVTATPPRYHHHQIVPRHHLQQHHRSMSPMKHQQQQPPPQIMATPSQQQPQTANMRASPTYEDVIRSSGLPKSLSFRKICSKCGKTRGEHGELGFGNKCIYMDCGKCGAGVQMHLKAGVPMGILCTLTVEDGATPGSSASYDRKIRELAARAELQKELQKRKQEAARRAVATGVP